MKRIYGFGALLAMAFTLWIVLLRTDTKIFSKAFIVALPVLVIGCYGLVNLGLVIYKVVHFKTYPKEYESLLEDIQRARKHLKAKGMSVE